MQELPTMPTLEFYLNSIRFVALMDSGSQLSHLHLKIARALKLNIDYSNTALHTCANNTKMETVGTAFMKMRIGHIEINHNFFVNRDLGSSCVIGRDILQAYHITVNHGKDFFYFESSPSKIYKFAPSKNSIIFSLQPNNSKIEPNTNESRIQQLIAEFPTVFRNDGLIGQTDLIMHKIELNKNDPKATIPISLPPTIFPPVLSGKIEEQIQDLLKHGKISKSKSPYRFPIVLDDKKDGGIRITVNYKKLNTYTVNNATPMHNANIILRLLPTGGVFSSLDLRSSFWQVALHPESRHLTAFDANGVLYEWNVMPFGLKGSPSTYVMLMNEVLSGLIMKICFVYIDDIVIFSKNFEDHLKHLKVVFERLKEANLTVNLKKSTFAQDRLEYLGHIVSLDGLRKNPAKVRAIVEMPPPKDKAGVKRLQGFLSWVITFAPHFSSLFQPISKLTKKDVKFIWKEEQQKSFEILKKILATDVVLQGLDYNYPIYIRTDASEFGIGFCMCQEIDGVERIVCYGSATLNDTQLLWTVCEKECWAIVYSIIKSKPFLQGQKFTVYTDNIALTNLKAYHDKSRRLTNWSHFIERWGCDIVYTPAKRNWLADCLSRSPVEPLKNESDQLELPEERYFPIFSLTFVKSIIDEIRHKQRNDEECRSIVAELNKGKKASSLYQKYQFKDGILHRKIIPFQRIDEVKTDKTVKKDKEVFEVVPVVPECLKEEVMRNFHEPPEFAHFGIKKTSYAIKQRFFWNNMNKDIKKYVRSCDICQCYKSENLKAKGLMGEVPIASSVFETIYIDFIGPLPLSKNRNRFCIVLVDQLSGWVELKPMPCTTSKRVTDFLEDCFCRFGVPKILLTDNASYFISKTMRNFLKDWNVKHKLSSAYHAQVNRSERTNKDLVRMIASYIGDNHNEWDKYLQYFALALRTHINDTIKVAPSMLMLGRKFMLPIDRVLEQDGNKNYDEEAQNIIENLPEHLKKLKEFVTQNIRESQLRNKAYYDVKHRPYEFNVGDFVLVRNNQLSNAANNISAKLLPKWIGPVKILRKHDLSYILDLDKKFTPKRHVSDLKPYNKPVIQPKGLISLKKIQIDEEPEIPIERQLRTRPKDNYRTLAGYRENKIKTK